MTMVLPSIVYTSSPILEVVKGDARRAGVQPINVFFDFFSIGGLPDRLREEVFKRVIIPWREENTFGVIPQYQPFKDYRAFITL